MSEREGVPVRPGVRYAVIALVVVSLAVVLSRIVEVESGATASAPPDTSSATVLREPQPLPQFTLVDHRGGKLTNASLQEKWTLMLFGYTHCPDICPTGLSMLNRVAERLEQAGVGGCCETVFVSVDPGRDTTERLARFVPYFNPEFIGATGARAQIDRLTEALGIRYEMVDAPDSSMGYTVDHSAAIVFVNPEGEYHAVFGPPHDAAAIAKDIRALVNAGRV